MTGFDSKRQMAQDKMELADAYALTVAETPPRPTPLERKLSMARIERARNALESALEQQAEPPPEWLLIKNILDEYGLDAISFVAKWKAAQPEHPAQMARLGWQYVECPACGLEGARAFPKPEQEPVAWQWLDTATFRKKIPPTGESECWNPLYTSPPQQQAEPVAWRYRITSPSMDWVAAWSFHDKEVRPAVPIGKSWEVQPLYTTPPKRPWVGLTDEERMDVLLALNWDKQLTHMDTAKHIEAKLKAKND